MKKYLLPALFMCLYAGASAAETPKRSTDANLFGHVVDRETHEHLPYATVAVTGTAFGTTTDASVHYFLKNLPEGELTLEVRALGYASGRMTVALERGETYDEEAQQFLADRYIVGTCPHCQNEKAYGDQCEKCGSTLSPDELIDPHSAV